MMDTNSLLPRLHKGCSHWPHSQSLRYLFSLPFASLNFWKGFQSKNQNAGSKDDHYLAFSCIQRVIMMINLILSLIELLPIRVILSLSDRLNTQKGKSVFIHGGGRGREVREGSVDSSKGGPRSRGVYCWGRGEFWGHLQKHPCRGHSGFQRIKWLWLWMHHRDPIVWPQGGREEPAVSICRSL